jgi:hypothetical protein
MSLYTDLAREAFDKLDGVWSVQLFYRTWPYYARRANKVGRDPYEHFDKVLSENIPLPDDLPDNIKTQLQVYTKQLWAMSVVYIEAVLEHYFLASIELLSSDASNLPRSAGGLFRRLVTIFLESHGRDLIVPQEEAWQLNELAETRHLWVHKGGIVDQRYLDRTVDWWQSRSVDWFDLKPIIGDERKLTESYMKASIYFSKKLISHVDEQMRKVA